VTGKGGLTARMDGPGEAELGRWRHTGIKGSKLKKEKGGKAEKKGRIIPRVGERPERWDEGEARQAIQTAGGDYKLGLGKTQDIGKGASKRRQLNAPKV